MTDSTRDAVSDEFTEPETFDPSWNTSKHATMRDIITPSRKKKILTKTAKRYI